MFTHCSRSLLSIFATRKQNTGTQKLYSQLSERTDQVETCQATEGLLQGHVIALSFAVPPVPGALRPHSPYFLIKPRMSASMNIHYVFLSINRVMFGCNLILAYYICIIV
jgi:hypothetical protein